MKKGRIVHIVINIVYRNFFCCKIFITFYKNEWKKKSSILTDRWKATNWSITNKTRYSYNHSSLIHCRLYNISRSSIERIPRTSVKSICTIEQKENVYYTFRSEWNKCIEKLYIIYIDISNRIYRAYFYLYMTQ